MATNLQSLDSLIASEVVVELDGETVSGVFHISNFTLFKLGEDDQRIKEPFVVSKMVQRDSNAPFNAWLNETIASRDSAQRPQRDLIIKAVDDGVETRHWTVKGAWIQEVRYSDFDRASFELIEEIYVIMYDDIELGWPAS